jgi:hypothetical protein
MMKNAGYSLLACLFLLCQCRNDDDDASSIQKSQLIGVWQEVEEHPGDCSYLIKFDATHMYGGERCDADNTFYPGTKYTFDGKQTIQLDGIPELKILIRSISTTTMKLEYFYNNEPDFVDTYSKIE